jgi:hypothetical protein
MRMFPKAYNRNIMKKIEIITIEFIFKDLEIERYISEDKR